MVAPLDPHRQPEIIVHDVAAAALDDCTVANHGAESPADTDEEQLLIFRAVFEFR